MPTIFSRRPFSFGTNASTSTPASGEKMMSDRSGQLANMEEPPSRKQRHQQHEAQQRHEPVSLQLAVLHAGSRSAEEQRAAGHQFHDAVHHETVRQMQQVADRLDRLDDDGAVQ